MLCVSSKHKDIALKAIRSLYLFSQSRKIFVITSLNNFTFFENRLETRLPVYLLDEDQLIENINLRVIQNIFDQRIGSHQRSGWYFQQFLKMYICNLSDVADHYLIWDSDTILLRAVDFFDKDGRVLVNPTTQYHQPYFNLITKILGIKKQVIFSFISEHFMIRKTYMKELISNFTTRDTSWVELILNSIDNQDLRRSGFSEYETYGNFIALNYKNSFNCRPIKSTRNGAKYYGKNPNKYDIFSLMQACYMFATFEARPPTLTMRIAVNKVNSRINYTHCHLTNRCNGRLNAAAEICR